MTETALVEKRREQSRFVPGLENAWLSATPFSILEAPYAQTHERNATSRLLERDLMTKRPNLCGTTIPVAVSYYFRNMF
jgi:hypothetical protein